MLDNIFQSLENVGELLGNDRLQSTLKMIGKFWKMGCQKQDWFFLLLFVSDFTKTIEGSLGNLKAGWETALCCTRSRIKLFIIVATIILL